MDVLIMPTGVDIVDGVVRVYLMATAVMANGTPLKMTFGVNYLYGATLAQKRTAINTAATQAFIDTFGVTPPVGTRSEIIGIS